MVAFDSNQGSHRNTFHWGAHVSYGQQLQTPCRKPSSPLIRVGWEGEGSVPQDFQPPGPGGVDAWTLSAAARRRFHTWLRSRRPCQEHASEQPEPTRSGCFCVQNIPRQSNGRNMKVLGPEYCTHDGFWDLVPPYLSIWTSGLPLPGARAGAGAAPICDAP